MKKQEPTHPADKLAASPVFWAKFLRCYEIAAGRASFSRAYGSSALAKPEGR